jgi:hypothetical protein
MTCSNRFALRLTLVASGAALLACASSNDCERTWDVRVPSADRAWTAVAHEEACKFGIVSDLSIVVELQAKGDSAGQVVMWPSGQWTRPHPIQLHWLAGRQLEVLVPNRTIVEDPVWHYKDVEVRVRYEHDNPEDRARWLDWVKENQAWVDRRDGSPQPKPPAPPDSGAQN